MKSVSTRRKLTTAQLVDETLSICTKCFKIIPAKIIRLEDDRIFIEKEHCGERESLLLENNSEFYRKMYLPFKEKKPYLKENLHVSEILGEMIKETPILTIHLTEKCNMNCPICYLKLYEHPEPKDPPLQVLERFFSSLEPRFIYLTGGEPTVREDLTEIIKICKRCGHFVGLYTNGIKLANLDYVKKLKEAGVDEVVLSLDGFDEAVTEKFRGKGVLEKKLKALQNLKLVGIPTFIAAAIKIGINEQEIEKIVDFSVKNSDFVKEICFLSLEEGRKGNREMTRFEMYKLVEEKLSLPAELFFENKRLRYALCKSLDLLFGKDKSHGILKDNLLLLKVKDGKLRPILSTEECKKLADSIEEALDRKSKLSFIRVLIKNIGILIKKDVLRIGVLFFSKRNLRKISEYLLKSKYIKLRVGEFYSPQILDLCRNHVILSLSLCPLSIYIAQW